MYILFSLKTYKYADGSVFEGEYRNDQKNGYGVMKFKNGIEGYEG